MLDHFGDVSDVTGPNFTKNTFNDPDNASNEPVPLFRCIQDEERIKTKKKLTQKTPTVLNEQKGGRSGLIIQNMPCNCQLINKRMKKWCEYQNRSKWILRILSLEKNTMAARQAVMIQPVIPGPVVKLRLKKIRRRAVVEEAFNMANL